MTNSHLYVMCGFPCSGKSFIAKGLANDHGFTRFSTDDLRKMMFGVEDYMAYEQSPDYNEKEYVVGQTIQNGKMAALFAGQNVVIDASSTYEEWRQIYFDTGIVGQGGMQVPKTLIYVKTDWDLIRERNLRKGRDGNVVSTWQERWEEPQTGQGYDICECSGDDIGEWIKAMSAIGKRFSQ
jgi:predicted kinase